MGIKRFDFGKPIKTNSVVYEIKSNDASELNKYFNYEIIDNIYYFSSSLDIDDAIYGLGENVKGINKRGSLFKSFNTDDPFISEWRENLYASHNFFIVSNKMKTFGVFIDSPKFIKYDFGFTDLDSLKFSIEDGFSLYIIESNDTLSELEIIKQFRELIGPSYIAPFFGFGVGQSRWGYLNKEDLISVIDGFKEKHLPLDMLFMDIDCLDDFEDFTFNDSFYKDGEIDKEFFKNLVKEHVHLIPIVDAAVKVKKGYFLYEELIEGKGYTFNNDKDKTPYIVGVWPGDSILPDYFSKNGQEIFGRGYKKYLDLGIDGFWNDMNEPALFYGRDNLNKFSSSLKNYNLDNLTNIEFEEIKHNINSIKNSSYDYKNMYHNYDLEYDNNTIFNHYDIHNMYGSRMVEAGSKYFDAYNKENNLNKKYLLFSRSSMIGSHRYGGIWTGDNSSIWDHLLMNIKMMPSLNMCGYLYSGADIGGFGQEGSLDLMLRWMAFGIFTPLFRNHACNWVNRQDYHLLKKTDIVRNLLSIRYAILPYLYSEYIKAVYNNTLLFAPLGFVYKDKRSLEIEDELLFGKSIIIAPVYNQNAKGRMVYLPDDAMEVRMESGNKYKLSLLSKGDHYISCNLNEVVFFLLDKEILPIMKIKDINNIKNIESLNYNDFDNLEFIDNGYQYDKYQIYYEDNNEVKVKVIEIKHD